MQRRCCLGGERGTLKSEISFRGLVVRRRRKWLRAKGFYNHKRNNSKKTEQEASLKGPQFPWKRNTCPKIDDSEKPNKIAMRIKELSLPTVLQIAKHKMKTISSEIENTTERLSPFQETEETIMK